ncbi:MAG: hypothetical protein KBT11_07550 [Treponema sp.]|nr:hypothetical protein [Candidatus Treponema equifaecale]
MMAGAACVFAAPKFNGKKAVSVLSREDGSGTRGAFNLYISLCQWCACNS